MRVSLLGYADDLAFVAGQGIVLVGRHQSSYRAWVRVYDEQGQLLWAQTDIFVGTTNPIDMAVRDDGLIALGATNTAALVDANSLELLPFAAPKLAWADDDELYVGDLGPGDLTDDADFARVRLTGTATWQRYYNRALQWDGPAPSQEEVELIAAHPCGGFVALVRLRGMWTETSLDVPSYTCDRGQVGVFFVDPGGQVIALDRINTCASAQDLKVDREGNVYVLIEDEGAWLRKYSLEQLRGP